MFSSELVIQAENIKKFFSNDAALKDITLSVLEGQIFGFWDLLVQVKQQPLIS
ncbi:ABC-type multidrug transport system, ATPase component precursor [Streptococcus troglodytae]|uniref:ABC-type multidrug transport system, ATPase component n=1 Tax=Streptococcus troglodytae TaxID=1111760 RepID=A0A1L7LGY3_9STRE|nr:ABC-type multidrug transport system, ATPase component precursor [Streptococcus troglodytae]